MNWKRMIDFKIKKQGLERWIYNDGDIEKKFDVNVRFGKQIDIVKLKGNTLSNLKYEIEKVKTSRTDLYSQNQTKIESCPICGDQSKNHKEVLEIYKASYVQCSICSHCYVINRPSKKHLESFYSESAQYQSTYTDKDSILTRINDVAVPKLKYIIQEYERKYKRKPKSILDVGAGSGHFVYACRNQGIRADGIEISDSGRKFCKENFGIELFDKDFIESYEEFKRYDIITFWGVIEHIPSPINMLDAARKITFDGECLIVVEVPRWDSLSTGVQKITPETIVRHLDPLGHINLFTDASLSTTFIKSGIDIISAWYFGMDIYEVFSQITNITESEDTMKDIRHLIPELQTSIDNSRLSDGIVLIGKPMRDGVMYHI